MTAPCYFCPELARVIFIPPRAPVQPLGAHYSARNQARAGSKHGDVERSIPTPGYLSNLFIEDRPVHFWRASRDVEKSTSRNNCTHVDTERTTTPISTSLCAILACISFVFSIVCGIFQSSLRYEVLVFENMCRKNN